MKKITIEIETVNAAFEDYGTIEVSRILSWIANRLDSNIGSETHTIIDINGNKCGKITVE